MPTLKVPTGNGVYKNVDGTQLSDKDAELVNCYVDETDYTVKRPGLLLLSDITSTLGITTYPINGLYWWHNKAYLIVVAYGKVLKVQYSSGYTTVTDLTSASLSANTTATFTTDGTYLFVANGGKIHYTNGSTTTAAMADSDAPTVVTHVDWLDGYLLAAGDGTNKFYWSDVNTPLSWNALSYASAEGDADPITALKVFQRQIFLFGGASFEVWQNDGTTPFIRVPGGFHNVGCIAPYSIVFADQSMYWLSDNRSIVRFQNGGISYISTPYDRDIYGYTAVSDCRGYKVDVDGNPFLLFVFPTEKKVLVYSLRQERWSEWKTYNTSTAEWALWEGGSLCSAPVWGKTIVGSSSTGKIYFLDRDTYSDNGIEIKMVRTTGHISYGVLNSKRNESLSLRLRRGVGGIAKDPKLMFRYRTDNKIWSNEKQISLGKEGDTDIVVTMQRLGMFKTRQYEFSITDNVPVSIGDAEETITLLR